LVSFEVFTAVYLRVLSLWEVMVCSWMIGWFLKFWRNVVSSLSRVKQTSFLLGYQSPYPVHLYSCQC